MFFIQQGIKFTEGLPLMTWILLVLWFDITHTDKHIGHTGTTTLTHTYKYILTAPVMGTQQLPLVHWMDDLLIQIFTLKRSTMTLLFKYFLLLTVLYLLITFNKPRSFLWNTKNTDKNGAYDENNTTYRETERKITLERVS